MAYSKLLLHLLLVLFILSFTSGCKKSQHATTTKVTPQTEPNQSPQKKDDNLHDFNNCREGKPCTDEEIKRIRLLQSWLDKLSLRHNIPLDEKYYTLSPTDTYDPSIYFLGEFHGNFDIVFDNFSLIEQHYKSGNIILFEGDKRGYKIQNCLFYILAEIYTAHGYTNSKEEYNPHTHQHIYLEKLKQLNDVYHVLKTQNIHLKNAQCEFWDVDHDDLENKNFCCHEKLRFRNSSLVATVKDYNAANKTLFVIAGNRHTPTGEYSALNKDYPSQQQLQNFYQDVNESDEVTTEEIYNAFKNSSIRYFNHKTMTY